jgi:predicted DNA-binding transcriptional regulator AlpA
MGKMSYSRLFRTGGTMQETITTHEAMTLLGISRMTFYRWVKYYGFTSPDPEHKGGRAQQTRWHAARIREIAQAQQTLLMPPRP